MGLADNVKSSDYNAPSLERLLPVDAMDNDASTASPSSPRKGPTNNTLHLYTDSDNAGSSSREPAYNAPSPTEQSPIGGPVEYRTYRRRWFGLFQLTLLNIIVSWDWLTYAPVSTTSAQFFNTTTTAINWLSTAFLFAFVAATPVVIYTLNRGGPKPAIVSASALILVGNWIRYGGARVQGGSGGYAATMVGQILIGLAQPFVLAAPTRYSDMWFGEKGRITATALASLANPFGGALGQLIDPFWTVQPSDVPNMVLYVAIISTVASLPSFFIPHHPPTPPSATSSASHSTPITLRTLKTLMRNPSFQVIVLPFALGVSNFNALSSLLNVILEPYGFDETEAGITGAVLIVAGLVAAAITSPLLDRHLAWRIPTLKLLVPVLAALYTAFVFVPSTRSAVAAYVVAGVLGAASFILVPLALEMLVEVTYPVSPEVSSTFCWAAGQLGGGLAIVVADALSGTWKGEPPANFKAGLVLFAVMAWIGVPGVMLLGFMGLGRSKRLEGAGGA